MNRVPELSLRDYTQGDAQARAQFSVDVFAGLRRFGFLILKDHSVPVSLLDCAYRLSEQLFALELAIKCGYRGGLRGYTPFGTEHAKNSLHADLKEFWQIGREESKGVDHREKFAANVWPTQLPDFRDTFLKLYAALDETAQVLLRALTPPLDLAPDYFDSRVRHGNSVLRLIHYPPVATSADPGCVRSAPHEDINFLTVLVAARGAGLELLDHDSQWLPVRSDPRYLIINSGDMLARLTNDVIAAKTHRVVNPTGPNESRYSMPFFLHPNSATSLRCLPSCVGSGEKYPEISAGEFLEQRLREIGLHRS